MNFFTISAFIIYFPIGAGQSCTEIIENLHYSCMGRNLSYIPSRIPSSVQTLDFSFNDLKWLKKTVFPVFTFLRVLDLSRCHIRQIENDAFYNVKNLTTLFLTGNPIIYFAPGCLNTLYNLQRLVLVDIGLESLQLNINNLTKLQELNVGTNYIQSMTLPPFMSTFKDFSLLDLHANNISIIRTNHTVVLREIGKNMTLILSRNPLLHIEPGSFKGVHLVELDIRSTFVSFASKKQGLNGLHGLNVTRLMFGMYKDDPKLYPSDLDYFDGLCSIHFYEAYYYMKERLDWKMNIFRCMINATVVVVKGGVIRVIGYVPFHKIKELYLINTQLYTVPGKQLSHIRTLEKFVFTHNSATQVEKFLDMPKLQYVDLNSNQITLQSCCIDVLSGTPQIRYLNLSLNPQISLDKGGFEGLESLEILDFHHTKLLGIGSFTLLSNLKNLRYLDISYSSVTFVNVYCFYGLSSLKVLKMAGNSFQGDVANYLFNNLTFLEHLDISYCHVIEIHLTSFKNLQRLRHLNLRGNNLMSIDFLTDPNLKQLTTFYVNKNSITTIPLDILQKLPMNLSEFDLSFNPIDCSCSQTDFMLWIINNQRVLKQPENILCKTISPNSDFRVTDFDIDHCVYKKKLIIALLVFCVVFIVVLSILVYRFQFYLRYCWILLRGYRSPGQQECSYDAFVIFSSYDEAWVMNELMENLENGVPPIQLCLHMRDFQAGKSIASNIIDEGIMGSRKIIVVVSQHFIDSAWCRFEFELAQSRFVVERNANIIIIILEDVAERKTKKVLGLHKHLKKNTYLKWSRDPLSNMRFWIRLRKAIVAT
ncbi:toll-like receptor 4a, like [Danio rerio]|uniref:Toll-like receptor 4 n=1 Tax=Danio rerio TaxID=7955 RepID=F6NLN8_DANRE|nr:toll-like receptor 4a, like precursor [Danio rerio]|eukprot:NP_001315534.1 toll-like receptor 4a, like precursor [Danio rerio]